MYKKIPLLLYPFLLIFPTLLLATHEISFSSSKPQRIIFIDSYHLGYDWSAGVISGARSILQPSGVKMKVISMDTKRNPSEIYIKKAALQAREKIEQWQPDLIIACDDNASKYLIEPYFKNSSIPVVFCGINWDASVYGYPYKNATGMVEVSMMVELIKELRQYAKGKSIGILAGDVISDRKSVRNYIDKLGINFKHKVFVSNIEQWKKSYIKLQDKVDILIIENSMSIKDWEADQVYSFILNNTHIPTGSVQVNMRPFVLIGFLQVPEEQGRYSAKIALRILAGESPEDIPIVRNKQVITSVNLDLAKKLNIVFNLEFIRNAKSFRGKVER